jgi:multidrug efflux system membrane fusion protein
VRPVTVDSVSGESAAIGKGLDSGAVVVIDGADRLRNGTRVDARPPVAPAAANPAGPAARAHSRP